MSLTYEQLIGLLTSSDISAKRVSKSDVQIQELLQLDFNMPTTEEKGQLILNLLSPTIVSALFQSQSELSVLSFTYVFPFKVEKAAAVDTLLLINRLNKSSLLAGFGFDELDHSLFFRQALPVLGNPTKEFLAAFVRLLINQLDVCQEAIRAVAEGDLSYAQLVKDSEEIFTQNTLDLFDIKEK